MSISFKFCLALLILSIFSRCGSDLDRKIQVLANDGILNKEDIQEIKHFAGQTDCEEFLKSNNDSLCQYIRKVCAGKNVNIECGPAITETLASIRFYIETSGSMGGYLNGPNNFQDVVNNLIGSLTAGDEKSTIHFLPSTIAEDVVPYKLEQFRDDLTQSGFKISGHSPLHDVFRIILQRAGPNDLTFFVTDGIISGSNEDVRSNPQYNIAQRTLLMNKIQGVFHDKLKDPFAVSVYAFTSEFKTKPGKIRYYTYDNAPVDQTFKERPFYIFVMGKSTLVKENRDKIKRDPLFKPVKEMHFGLESEAIEKYVLFKSHLPNNATCMFQNEVRVKCNEEPSASSPVMFGVALNLSGLPVYARNQSYLDSNLRVDAPPTIQYKKEPLRPIDGVLKARLEGVKERPAILSSGSDYYLNVQVESFYSTHDTITIQVGKKPDNWYSEWSDDDDKDIGFDRSSQRKTFQLKYLIDGIIRAYNKQDTYVNAKIILTK